MRKFVFPVINGKVTNAQLIVEEIKKHDGKTIQITVEEFNPQRSGQQNKYYWAVVIDAIWKWFKECGHPQSREDIHEYLWLKVCNWSKVMFDPDTGEYMEIRKSSTKASTKQWEENMEIIKQWASEKGIFIPDPMPKEYEQYLTRKD
jgi:nitrite reductase/ring-hydroxylating ferredoxin subunit